MPFNGEDGTLASVLVDEILAVAVEERNTESDGFPSSFVWVNDFVRHDNDRESHVSGMGVVSNDVPLSVYV